MKDKKYGFGTEAVHGGEEKKFMHSPASTPIYQSSTFFFDSADEAEKVFYGDKEGFIYTRLGNPTIKAFEEKMSLLEGGDDAVAFSSGMAAVAAVLLEVLRPGDRIISSRRIYSGSKGFFENILKKLDCEIEYFEPYDDLNAKIPSLINKKTKLIFFETPSNPELSIIDIKLIARLAKRHYLISVIDNTFPTPYLQRPLSLGVDCVIHSATKYIGGHGDSIGGVVVSSKDFISGIRERMLTYLGACLSPFNAWLFLRGLKTLHVRMERHCKNAMEIAEFLRGHPKVKNVLYPGLKEHRGHGTAKRQMSGFGGMVSFRLRDRKECKKFLDNLELCSIGVSLGDAATLVVHSASMSHARLTQAACIKAGIDPELLRISVGLENPEDIIKDIKTALDTV